MYKRQLTSNHVANTLQIRQKSTQARRALPPFFDMQPSTTMARNASTHAVFDPLSVVQRHAHLQDQWSANQWVMRNLVETLATTTQLTRHATVVLPQKMSPPSSSSPPPPTTTKTTTKTHPHIQEEQSTTDPLLDMFAGTDKVIITDTIDSKLAFLIQKKGKYAKAKPAKTSTEQQLLGAIKKGNHRSAVNIYRQHYQQIPNFANATLKQVFEVFISRREPLEAHRVFTIYHERRENSTPNMTMLQSLCKIVATLDPVKHNTAQSSIMARNVMSIVMGLDRHHQELCLPKLCLAISEQRFVHLGLLAMKAYRYMEQHEFLLGGGYLARLLKGSRFYRREDLPFANIMQRLAEINHEPTSESALNALANLFPFTNLDETRLALEAISKWQANGNASFRIDMTTMEVIAGVAASQNATDVSLLLLQLVEQFGVTPSEGLLESIVVSLAVDSPASMWALLIDMEVKFGYKPSRPLVRSISLAIREDPGMIQTTFDALDDLYSNGTFSITTTCLNVIMSAVAERGGPCQEVYDLFGNYGVEPNADTYEYFMESLGKFLLRNNRRYDRRKVTKTSEKASAILDMMEQRKIPLSRFVVKDYIELLCLADDLDTATSCALDLIKNRDLVSTKTLYRVATANANAGRIEEARLLSRSYPIQLTFLEESISKIQEEMGSR